MSRDIQAKSSLVFQGGHDRAGCCPPSVFKSNAGANIHGKRPLDVSMITTNINITRA